MPLHVHRAQRSDALAAGLGELLRTPLADPMATEIISVPARGIERWLTQRLSHVLGTGPGGEQDGVCANIDFAPPAAVVQGLISTAGRVDPATDPWQVDRLVWPLLETIDAAVAEPWCGVLADHLGAGPAASDHSTGLAELRRSRRLSVARRLAGLFADYGDHRPNLLQDWAAGRDTDGCGESLPPQRLWQPELFRRLRAAVGVPSPAERLDQVCDALRADPAAIALPARLSVFGPTRLSSTQLRVLDAVAAHRDVHLWVPQPSEALWSRMLGVIPAEPPRRSGDPTAQLPRHPLLRSLGRDSRELQLRLFGGASDGVVDHAYPGRSAAPGVLGLLHRNLADDQAPPGSHPDSDTRPVLDASDRSIQIHACHGRDRQVEVLRDVLVGLLADDETLQPRDILVMCPDIEVYAPLILAAFGTPGSEPAEEIDGSHPGTRIRVRLADRALRRTNPVLDVLARLLELADSRMTASDVLDFAGLPPVQRRFGFDSDDADRLREWVISSGIRWGLNAKGRQRYGLDALPQNTWRAGLDRILLGVAMAEDDPSYLGTALPLDDVDSSDIDLAGRLAELVDRLALAVTQLSGSKPLAAWVQTLTRAIDSLAAVTEDDSWQADQAHRMIAESLEQAGERADRIELRLPDVVGLLSDALRGRPTRANFRTGELTICSMVPMRSVPHRVVCLLGLDDGEFPRTGRVDGDDVLAIDPLVGERDRTSEDRQLLLDAITAATENLVFLYSGADIRTGAHRPPAAALGEILDVLDATVRRADGKPARAGLQTRHPLQPFDSRNFAPGELVPDRPFSFDAPALAAARAGGLAAGAPAPFLPGLLEPPPAADSIELEALIRFFEHPVKDFLRQRLGLTGSFAQDEIPDELDVDLDDLARWSIGDRMLRSRLAGFSADEIRQAELRRGTAPPGRQGSAILEQLARNVDPLVTATAEILAGEHEQRNVDVALADGRSVVGSVGPLYSGVLTTVTYSTLGPKQRIRAWISLLALAASDPGFPIRALTVGRGGSYRPKKESRMAAPPADRARAMLADLVQLRDLGLVAPLPLAPKTSVSYVESRYRNEDPATALDTAATRWDDGKYPGEGSDEAHRRVWGSPGLHAIVEQLGGPQRPGESTRFGELAVRAYWPLVVAENVGGA